jgi:hypothetical protein
VEDDGAEVERGKPGQRGRGLGLMSALRGQSWCPDKGSVYEPT